SMATDRGENLLNPGDTPAENAQILLFLTAVIQAVDEYQDLLRISASSAGNDHRLGGDEAPPAILSVFLGDELTAILDAIENDVPYSGAEKKIMKLGVDVLPRFARDNTDRNRTSPFAFTGNKFEFRSLGSSNSIACANMMLNSAVAESLKIYADRLDAADDFEDALHEMIKKTIKDHKRILFNGNGYDASWVREATEKRGLLNYPTTPDCMPHLLDEKNVAMLTSHKVFTKTELESRCEIMLDNYNKAVGIEARTMVGMVKGEILPAVSAYEASLAEAMNMKKAADVRVSCGYETKTLRDLSQLCDGIMHNCAELEGVLADIAGVSGTAALSLAIRDRVLPAMAGLRGLVDRAETLTAKKYWPYPSYADILFSVR
ncbi:MAG: glutamine synthetase type III, partial [Clostridia bacterium]|nr:glutamine synthetase type III [Clostridia bacterium]